MARIREPLYSRVEEVHRSNFELFILIFTTIFIAILISLLSASIKELFFSDTTCKELYWEIVLVFLSLIVIVRTFPRTKESKEAPIEIWIPYLITKHGDLTIIERKSYTLTKHAKLLLGKRFGRNSPDNRDIVSEWKSSLDKEVSFEHFIELENAQLIQTLILQVLHMYGEDSLGKKADFTWWKSDVLAEQKDLSELHERFIMNPYTNVNFGKGNWKIWLPKGLKIELIDIDRSKFQIFRLVHHYGIIEIKALPGLSKAEFKSQPFKVLTQRHKFDDKESIFIIGTKLKAKVIFKRYWKGKKADEFHYWATGFLTQLQQSLDFAIYLENRVKKIIADLDWKLGYYPLNTSIWEKLENIEKLLLNKSND
ncbi:MAG: hypothetical protein ACTSUK_11315 [Promethearchaeota archaeon]